MFANVVLFRAKMNWLKFQLGVRQQFRCTGARRRIAQSLFLEINRKGEQGQ